jgi:hypothetical protein
MEIEALPRRWGSSIAIIVPNEVVIKEGIKENEPIIFNVKKKKPKAGILFGKFPGWGKSAQEIKDEMRRGWD